MVVAYLLIGIVFGLLSLAGASYYSTFANGRNFYAVFNIAINEFLLFLWIFGDTDMPSEGYFWYITGYNIMWCIGTFLVKDGGKTVICECKEKENKSMEKFLLCKLTDESYADPLFLMFDSMDEARTYVQNDYPKNFDEIIQKNYGYRYDICIDREHGKFTVVEIHPVKITESDSILIMHHAYDGVSFDIINIGDFEANKDGLTKTINSVKEKYPGAVIDNVTETSAVIDIETEWVVISIIQVSDLLGKGED